MKSPTLSPSYIIRNRYSYCFRLRIPPDLQGIIGKKELRYSLKTGYIRKAKEQARLLAGLFQKLFTYLRNHSGTMNLSDQEISGIIEVFKLFALDTFVQNLLAGVSGSVDATRAFGHALSKAATSKIGIIGDDCSLVAPALDSVLEGMQYDLESDIDRNSAQYKELCRTLLRISIEHMDQAREKLNTEYPELELDRLYGQTKADKQSEEPELESSITLSGLIQLYELENQRAANWSFRTTPEYQSIFHNIVRILGDKPVAQLNKQTCLRFKEILMGLPKTYFRSVKKYEDKTLDEVVSKAKAPLLSVKTVNKYLDNLTSLLRYGKANGYLNFNPAEGLRIKRRHKRPDLERDEFSIEDLRAIFNSDEYLNDKLDPPWKFWLPILGLYTGCRLEELCQLNLGDVQEIGGVWTLNIRGDASSGKRTKTLSSDRLVPLHPFIVEDLKFVRFVHSLQDKDYERLFPELKKQSGRYGHYPSRWFGIFKKKVGITSQKKVFHSFRHNVQNLLKQQLVAEGIIDELVGHKPQGETMGRYGKRFDPKVIYENAVLKLDYGIDLSHLKRSRWISG